MSNNQQVVSGDGARNKSPTNSPGNSRHGAGAAIYLNLTRNFMTNGRPVQRPVSHARRSGIRLMGGGRLLSAVAEGGPTHDQHWGDLGRVLGLCSNRHPRRRAAVFSSFSPVREIRA